VWPNPAFPFRVYYDGPECRIFMIVNIQHNFGWISKYHHKFRESDIFLVRIGSFWGEWLFKNAMDMFEHLNLPKDNFFVLFNDERDKDLFEGGGMNGEIINQNCWLDYNGSMKIIDNAEKKYDAICVARLIAVKRHYLANKVANLAIVAGDIYGENILLDPPPHIYRNEKRLTPDEVCARNNEAHCGIILSQREGACFASSEYLLCGIPVVSTYSEGGRGIWYNDYNSLVVEDDEDAVAEAVQYFVDNPRDPNIIRQMHIDLANEHRQRYIDKLGSYFSQFGVDVNPTDFFNENFYHKMRKSYKPDFDEIFA
jgi:glycosyltransferase involved in cell wall biosynthesis